jgi:hypothetical protein
MAIISIYKINGGYQMAKSKNILTDKEMELVNCRAAN